MLHDNPSQHVQELLSETLWPDHPLGCPLTGSVETISRFKRDDFFGFKEKHYCGKTTIVTVAGRASHQSVLDLIGPVFGGIPKGRLPKFAPPHPDHPAVGAEPRLQVMKQETEQTHLALGFHAFGRHDERRFALKLLSVILGENMSSRLFQKLRERHGFCYSVQSGIVGLEDAGALTVFAGLDPAKLEKATRMILQEVDFLCAKAPSPRELRQAQDYSIGQTLMGLESTTNQMMWMGESLLSYEKVQDPAEVERRLLAVTPEEVRAVAQDCLHRSRLALSLAGPSPDPEKIRGWL
jgi:predicted Zn-dependent peptidase